MIVKIDSLGNKQWLRCIGDSDEQNVYSYDIHVTNDNNYIVVGSMSLGSPDLPYPYSFGPQELDWVVKLDTIGNILWKQHLCVDEMNGPYIQQTNDNGYIVVVGSDTMADSIVLNYDIEHFAIFKLDSVGNIIWKKEYGCDVDNYGEDPAAVIQTLDGGYIIAGTAGCNGGNVSGYHGGNSDAWLVKIDKNGKLQWAKCYGGSNIDYATDITQLNNGHYVFSAYSNSIDGDLINTRDTGTCWIVEIDSIGNILWNNRYGGTSGYDFVESLQKTSDDNLIFCGSSLSQDGDVYGNSGSNYWVVKLFTPHALYSKPIQFNLVPIESCKIDSVVLINYGNNIDTINGINIDNSFANDYSIYGNYNNIILPGGTGDRNN